jgi:hypothetical protein
MRSALLESTLEWNHAVFVSETQHFALKLGIQYNRKNVDHMQSFWLNFHFLFRNSFSSFKRSTFLMYLERHLKIISCLTGLCHREGLMALEVVSRDDRSTSSIICWKIITKLLVMVHRGMPSVCSINKQVSKEGKGLGQQQMNALSLTPSQTEIKLS